MYLFRQSPIFLVVIALITKTQCQEVQVTKLQEPTITGLPNEVVAYQLIYTYAPGSQGNGPHFHSGPALGYVLQGNYLFQTDGEDPRLVKTGETVYIKDGGTHIWSANPTNDIAVQVLFCIYGRPGEPIVTYRGADFERMSFEEAMKIATGSK